MNKPLKLKEIAARIDAHLKRLEADKSYNKRDPKYRVSKLYSAGAGASGSRVFVTYVSYQTHISLTREKAEAYLAWLDAGNKGRHYGIEKQMDEEKAARSAASDGLAPPAGPVGPGQAAG